MTLGAASQKEGIMFQHNGVDDQARLLWAILAGLGALLGLAGWIKLMFG